MQFLRRLLSAALTPFRASSTRAAGRAGYDGSLQQTLTRVQPMLAVEPVVWLSTVRPDGLPHLVPTWFWWDGEALRVFSKPDAVKVRNLRANPRLMVALGRPVEDFSVGLIEARASIRSGAARIPDAFFAKYATQLEAGGFGRESFRATYTREIRIVPTRFLAWHGRGGRHAAPADAPVMPADTPVAGLRGTLMPAWA